MQNCTYFSLCPAYVKLSSLKTASTRLGVACHGIFPRSFALMMSQKKAKNKGSSEANMTSLLQGILTDLTGCMHDESGGPVSMEDVSAPFTAPEMPVSKVQGVRALKTCAWLGRAQTATEIFVAVLGTQPLQHLSAWFLGAQGNMSWLSEKIEERPVVNLVSLRFSPVVRAINEAILLLRENCILGAPEPIVLLNGHLTLFLHISDLR